MRRDRLLAFLLRIAGSVELLAFGAVVMPREVMADWHGRLGLGTFPPLGVTDFMIRQASYTYAMHGVMQWLFSFDVIRYRPLVRFTGLSYCLAGPVFYWINSSSGLPDWWAIGDGLACCLFGAAVLGLSGTKRSFSQPSRPQDVPRGD